MADVQISVRLGRKARNGSGMLSAVNIARNNLADKIFFFVAHCLLEGGKFFEQGLAHLDSALEILDREVFVGSVNLTIWKRQPQHQAV